MELYRNRFIQVAFGRNIFGLSVWTHDDHDVLQISILGLSAYINIPRFLPEDTKYYQPIDYGFCFHDKALHINYGIDCKIYTYPWCNWEHIRHEVMLNDNTFVKATYSWKNEKEPENLWKKTQPYHYILKSGEIQTVDATYIVEEREWKLKYFKWLPIKRVSRSIEVSFSEEVGEERGSWKGGVTGTSEEMKKVDIFFREYEKPERTLYRMMRIRYFGKGSM